MAAAADHPLIRTRKLTRIYCVGSSDVVGVEDIDLEIASGDMVVMKGNSGSGKSTLLGLLGGLDRPTRGRLTVAGRDLQSASAAELNAFRRDIVGMVFQTFNLLPTLTVIENVCLPARMAGKPFEKTRSRALGYLEWLKLTQRLNHYPAQLSGGEMQRVAIARALINDPSLILADEPTGNLDSQNGQAVFELLSELNRRWGRTVVIATHSRLADPFATVQICLKDGRISERSVCTA